MAVVVSCEDQAAGTGLFQWDFYNSGLSGAVHTVIHQDGHTEIVGNHIQNRINPNAFICNLRGKSAFSAEIFYAVQKTGFLVQQQKRFFFQFFNSDFTSLAEWMAAGQN